MNKKDMLALFIKLGKKAKGLIKEVSNGKQKLEKNYFGDTSIKMDLVLEDMVKEEIKDLGFNLITEEKPQRSDKTPVGTIILDPLDGSKNYERGFPAYAFAIVGSNKNNPTISDMESALVVNLFTGDEYYAIKGEGAYKNSKKIELKERLEDVPLICGDFGRDLQSSLKVLSELNKFAYMRMLGAATLEMASAAQGTVDAYIDVRGQLLVTHTAGMVLMKEAGLTISDKQGNEISQMMSQDTKFTIIASKNKNLHRKLVDLCRNNKNFWKKVAYSQIETQLAEES